MNDRQATVTVQPAPGWRCERCRKYTPEVGLCNHYPDLCLRCRDVVAASDGVELEDADLHVMAARRFDRFMAEEKAAGFALAEAVRRAGNRNAGYTADRAEVAWRGIERLRPIGALSTLPQAVVGGVET